MPYMLKTNFGLGTVLIDEDGNATRDPRQALVFEDRQDAVRARAKYLRWLRRPEFPLEVEIISADDPIA